MVSAVKYTLTQQKISSLTPGHSSQDRSPFRPEFFCSVVSKAYYIGLNMLSVNI